MVTAVENEYKFTKDSVSDTDRIIEELRGYLKDHDIPFKEKSKHSVDEYFDTPEMFLYERDCILRRKTSSDGKVKLTAKKPKSNGCGMMSRIETEALSDGSLEELLSFFEDNYAGYILEKEPVLLIEAERTAFDYKDGSGVKLSFDSCTYKADGRSHRFYEIEVESMDDDLERDFDAIGILDFIEKDLNFERTIKSKYARGVEWLSHDQTVQS